jgi:hypothetical protein
METLSAKSVLATDAVPDRRQPLDEPVSSGAAVTVLDLPSASWDRLSQTVLRVRADILDQRALSGALGI